MSDSLTISPGRSCHLTGPATLQSVRSASTTIRHFLTESGLAEEELAAWELILAEAGNNCVIHGADGTESGTLDILVTVTGQKVMARLVDQTEGFDWPAEPTLPSEEAEGGRGLFLIHNLTDARIYSRSPGGNILELERTIRTALPPPEDFEATLFSMTEELSSCYESLASIFHFIAEARTSDSLEAFASRVLAHLIQATSANLGILRLVNDENQLTTLARHGVADFQPFAIEAEAAEDQLDRWIASELPGLASDDPLTGLVHPFCHDDQLVGTLLLARTGFGRPFNAGEVSMIRTFSEFLTQHILGRKHEEEAIRSSVARHEFELAANIQQSLLPPPLPPICGVSTAGYCQSALSVGGDFYDLIPLEGRGFFFVIADVMGKGAAASMIAAVTRSVIRSLTEDMLEPAALLEKVAHQMGDDLDRLEMFVTIAVGVVDVPAGLVRIANAGHCPVVVAGDHTVDAAPENPPLGIERRPTYKLHAIPLTDATRILAYTDGFVDPRNDPPGFADEEEVTQWFGQNAAKAGDVNELKGLIHERLGHNAGSAQFADDQTFLLLSCNPTP